MVSFRKNVSESGGDDLSSPETRNRFSTFVLKIWNEECVVISVSSVHRVFESVWWLIWNHAKDARNLPPSPVPFSFHTTQLSRILLPFFLHPRRGRNNHLPSIAAGGSFKKQRYKNQTKKREKKEKKEKEKKRKKCVLGGCGSGGSCC